MVLALAAQLEHLHEVHEATRDTDFDDRLVISLLLCLAAGERNLVLRIGAEDELLEKKEKREWVKRVGEEVAWICSTIFALSTHRVSCTSDASPTTFLRSLFVPPSPVPSLHSRPADSSKRETRSMGSKKQDRGPRRSSSVPLAAVLPPAEGPRPRPSPILAHPSPTRRLQNDWILGQSSYFSTEPASLLPEQEGSSAGEDLFPVRPISPRPPSPDRRRSGVRRQTLNAVAANRRNEGGSVASSAPRALPAGNGAGKGVEPTTTPYVSARASPTDSKRPTPTQRTSTPRSAPIVSPLQPFNRPPSTSAQSALASAQLLSSSPSKPFRPSPPAPLRSETSPASLSPDFPPPSFSTPPLAPNYTRRLSAEMYRKPTPTVAKLLPQVLILERLERSRPSVQQALVDVLRERRIALSSAATRRTPLGDDGASMRTRRTEVVDEGNGWEGTFILPKGLIIVAIVCEKEEGEGDGAWGGLSRYLFDHFSLSHSLPSRAFFYPAPTFSAPSTHPLSPSHTPLLSPLPLPPSLLSSHYSPALETYTSDLLSTLRHHPLLEGRMLTARARAELVVLVHAWVEKSRGLESGPIVPQDVVSIVMGVVGHRLKMREAVDEKSMFWGSELGVLQRRKERSEGVERVVRRVVKEV